MEGLCAQPESERECAGEHRLGRGGPVPDTVFYKGPCHTEATSRATGEPQCGHTGKWALSLEKATETELGQQMEVRGGGLWLLLEGACTADSLPTRQRHPGCPPVSIQAEFWKSHCGWLPPMGGGTRDPLQLLEVTVHTIQVLKSSFPPPTQQREEGRLRLDRHPASEQEGGGGSWL